MRAIPADGGARGRAGLGFRPMVDGRFLPRSLAAIFAAGEHTDVPLMAGWKKDEGINFTWLHGGGPVGTYETQVRERFGWPTPRRC